MQLLAILVDTWRLLCARRLFWFTLVLTAVIGIVYASIGFHEKGFFLLFRFSFDNAALRAGTPQTEVLYLNLFYQIINWWTTFFGVILALVSCASIFPEFMASGAIDAVLAKPISRTKLFFFKFLSGLLFAATQIALLAVIVFLAIKWRLGFWHGAVFWSLPLGLALYSYLYAINVLFAVWTRSALASLLLTLVVWAGISFLHLAESLLGQLSVPVVVASARPGAPPPSERATPWVRLHQGSRILMAVLPKTAETTDLIRRRVMRDSDKAIKREQDLQAAVESRAQLEGMFGENRPPTDPRTARSQAEQSFGAIDALEKSSAFILGTSLAFEALVLAVACWLFSRRDY